MTLFVQNVSHVILAEVCAKKAEDSIEKTIAGFELRVGFFLGGMAGLVNSWEGGAGGWISGDHTVQYSI